MFRTRSLLTAATLVLVLALPAFGQEYPVTVGDLNTPITTVEAGGEIPMSGTGFLAGSEIVLTVESEPVEVGRVNADATGSFATTVRLPADFPAGAHTAKATGQAATGGTLVLATPIQVGGALPFTGPPINLALASVVAALLVVAGAVGLHHARQ